MSFQNTTDSEQRLDWEALVPIHRRHRRALLPADVSTKSPRQHQLCFFSPPKAGLNEALPIGSPHREAIPAQG